MADAVVHIGPFRQPQARPIIRRFYENCGLEVVGPGRITTGEIKPFDTLEELIDNIHGRAETYHVIVCHGDSTAGIIVPFTRETTMDATGGLIRQLGEKSKKLSAMVARGPLVPPSAAPQDPDPELINLASIMNVPPAAALRLITKLGSVTPVHIEFRGCHLVEKPKPTDPDPDPDAALNMIRDYKRAFRALSVSAVDARMFFVGMVPGRPRLPTTMSTLSAVTPGGKTRRRVFRDDRTPALSQAGPLVIDVTDIDGHTQVRPDAFMDVPANVLPWAVAIDGAWTGTAGGGFVMQVIWDDDETSYHTPYDVSFRGRLKRV
jgi:hypothetical protein